MTRLWIQPNDNEDGSFRDIFPHMSTYWSMKLDNIIIIIIVIVFISFMQGILTCIPETNNVPREYSVPAILLLLFMVLISLVSVLNLLYFYISTYIVSLVFF